MADTTPIAAQSEREERPAVDTRDESRAPYFEALVEYARREPGRFNVPGHKGGLGSDAALLEALGERALGSTSRR